MKFVLSHHLFLSVDERNILHVWNLRNYSLSVVVQLEELLQEGGVNSNNNTEITCFEVLSQTTWLYIGTSGGDVMVFDLLTRRLSKYGIMSTTQERDCDVACLAENPADASMLLIAHKNGHMVVWDIKQRIARDTFHYQKDKVSCFFF